MPTQKKQPNPIDVYVGSRIRMRRNMLGMSQEKLGESLGITFQQIQKYEKGTNRVGASRLQAIASVLEVSPSFFFDGSPGAEQGFAEDSQASYVASFPASPEGLQLNRSFARIQDPKIRRKVADLVRALAGDE